MREKGEAVLPTEVQRYLHRAAGRNARLRAELHGDLHQRMLDYRLRGLNEAAAWTAAVQDFGPPRRAGPQLWRVLLAVGTLSAAAYAAAAHLGLM